MRWLNLTEQTIIYHNGDDMQIFPPVGSRLETRQQIHPVKLDDDIVCAMRTLILDDSLSNFEPKRDVLIVYETTALRYAKVENRPYFAVIDTETATRDADGQIVSVSRFFIS